MKKTDETIVLDKAAAYLADQVGGKVSHWAIWLRGGYDKGAASRIPGRGWVRYPVATIKALAVSMQAEKEARAGAVAGALP